MYSEIWLPDLLDSLKCDSSLLSIRLNCERREKSEGIKSQFTWHSSSVDKKQTPEFRGQTRQSPHLKRCHIRHTAVRLDRLQLVEAPVQLLNRIMGHSHVALVPGNQRSWQRRVCLPFWSDRGREIGRERLETAAYKNIRSNDDAFCHWTDKQITNHVETWQVNLPAFHPLLLVNNHLSKSAELVIFIYSPILTWTNWHLSDWRSYCAPTGDWPGSGRTGSRSSPRRDCN